jgi:hypothetical protein
VRQRLATLGHNPRSQDTTDANLSDLIEKLSSDLQNYTMAAQNWQKKLLALQSGQLTPEQLREEEKKAGSASSERRLLFLSRAGSEGTMEGDIIARLQRSASPTLEYVNMPLPKVRSSMVGPLAIVQSDECFRTVLNNIAELANLFGMFKGNSGAWSNITKLKPDFSEARARDIWVDLFEPIDTSFSSFQWASGPFSRALPSSQHSFEPIDDDSDHLDRRLAVATDYDVVDMLHYCSLMLVGFNQAVFENEALISARDHLGKQVERLLREAIFTRNIGANRDYAHGLLAGILGVLRHFSGMARSGAVVSLLEIAWATCMQHIENIHPIMKGVVSFVSTVLAPSQSRRAVWMARNQENFNSTTERYFHLTTTAYFAASYYALTTRDDDALLHYLAQLDEILMPAKPELSLSVSGPFYEDPTSCFHLGKHPNAVYNSSQAEDISCSSTIANSSAASSRPVSSFGEFPTTSNSPFISSSFQPLDSMQVPTYESTSLKTETETPHSSSLSHIQLQHSTSELVSPCFSSVLATSVGGHYAGGAGMPMTPEYGPYSPSASTQHVNFSPSHSHSQSTYGFAAPNGNGGWMMPPTPSDPGPGNVGTNALFQMPTYHVVANTSAKAPNTAKALQETPSSSPRTSPHSHSSSGPRPCETDCCSHKMTNISHTGDGNKHACTGMCCAELALNGHPTHSQFHQPVVNAKSANSTSFSSSSASCSVAAAAAAANAASSVAASSASIYAFGPSTTSADANSSAAAAAAAAATQYSDSDIKSQWWNHQAEEPFSNDDFDSTDGSSSQGYTASNGAYIPNEDFKSCLRAAVHLIRAEAALLTNDYATCRHWVDEAEREMNNVPDMFLHHKIFLVDVSVLKQVFHSPCPFPSGTRSVAEEFEKRIRVEADRRKAKFPLHRSGIRGDRI